MEAEETRHQHKNRPLRTLTLQRATWKSDVERPQVYSTVENCGVEKRESEVRHDQLRETSSPVKSILKVRQRPPSEQKSVRWCRQRFDRAQFRVKHPSLHVIQPPGGRSERSILAPPLDQTSTERNEEQEEGARHKAYKPPQGTLRNSRTPPRCPHRSLFSEVMFPKEATAQGLAIPTKDRRYSVDSGASVTHDGILIFALQTGKEDDTKVRQGSGHSDHEWNYGLRFLCR